ncbi:hypothetical protein ABT215_03640 [Streptomyces sp900105755]|uniref:hypothetical protein n=1 Tax=Streptomyces sp. 900105755 TaxID=3154389 RepID=UPI00331ECDE9
MRLTIDTETDAYEQAIAAVQAAYGLRPGIPAAWPDAPVADPRPGPQELAEDGLADGWSEQLLFHMIASLAPGARAVLRRDHLCTTSPQAASSPGRGSGRRRGPP